MPKVIMAWPPNTSPKGQPQHAQNRQCQYFKDPTYIYPVIPALFMTMLFYSKTSEIMWADGVAEEINDVEFGKLIVGMAPDYVVFEANTMLINRYAEIINGLKEHLPHIKIILCGEHLTALPEETKALCKADHYVLGGKWYYEAYRIITGKDWEGPLPHIHREHTRWWLYAYKNGNFKFQPGTYVMAGQDCWHRPGCSFCAWGNYHKDYVVRDVEDYLTEIEELITMGFKEIFDDSGTFPVGEWLTKFCTEMIDRGYNKYISWGCNMRFGALKPQDFVLMAKAGCRFILWGFESANQNTLDLLNKGYRIDAVSRDLVLSKATGIWNHLTVMFGYPWESDEEEIRTYKMVRWLLLKDWAQSAQATIFMPYPGTPMFDLADKEGILIHKDWDRWDMSESVLKQGHPKDINKMVRGIYNIAYHPKFVWNKLKQIRSIDDLRFYFRVAKKVIDRFGNIREIGKVGID
jgi:radical SAM superfamily enzyme YgiQ (UPF0313 family)